ncbi:transcriptional regulator NrdR [Bacteriovoracaceae bacterium]|nr:transcriptional regulator NrdR [Bacteriovoracaceae bacterium]
MNCPNCLKDNTKVLDSRHLNEGRAIRRRRSCPSCGKRFTTYERYEINLPNIIKRDGRREEYKKNKVLGGLEIACQKRPIPTDEVINMINQLEKDLMDLSLREVHSSFIGNRIMGYLKKLDPVAYIRFAAVYRKFQDIDDFVHKIQDSKNNPNYLMHEGKNEQ